MLAQPPALIAYVHADDLWEMDASGGGAHRVRRDVLAVAWAPDGTRLAIASEETVRTVAPDGSAPRVVARLRPGRSVVGVAWSPDGTRVAFGVDDGVRQRGRVETANPDGTQRQILASPRGGVVVSGWTADERVLYTRHRIVYAVGGGAPQRILTGARDAVASPDGAGLAFATARGIAVSTADGSGRRLVFRGPAKAPAWSADGTRLAFVSSRNLTHGGAPDEEVYSVAADGSCLTWLTNGDRYSAAPAWGPGPAAPDRCGHRDRAPRIEEGRPPTSLWGGHRFHGALLDDVVGGRRDGALSYDDCATFAPCATFVLTEDDSCRHGLPYLRRFGAHAGPGLVARYRRRAARLVGQQLVIGPDARRLRGLRRVDGKPVGPPRLARDAWRLLPARLRAKVRPC